jgi:PAS domain S-box-containing protein
VITILEHLGLGEWYYLLGSIALIAGAVLFLSRKVVLPMFRALHRTAKRVVVALDSVETIRKEMFPNGGGSMRDTVNATARAVANVAKDVSMSVAQNRSLAEQSGIGMAEGDADGEIVWTNRALRQMSGLRAEQIVGSGWINAVHDDDRRRVENDWRLASQQLRPFISSFRFAHIGTGATTPVYCEASPVFHERDRVVTGWTATFRARETP